ncbi:polysaccharide biosynthesis tyrosine autokinase [Pseudomonadota bacterium]
MNQHINRATKMQDDISTYKPIGVVLTGNGRLSANDSDKVVDYQNKHGIRFGEAAIALGLIEQNDVEQALSTQFAYPYIDSRKGGLSTALVLAHKPFAPEADEIRNARAQLVMNWSKTSHMTFCVLSSEQREGKSYIAANLAMGLAQLGKKTLLIDANLRTPKQHDIYNVPNNNGLALYLAGHGTEEMIKQLEMEVDLSILTAGPTPPNPLELISHSRMDVLLETLKNEYEAIVIDTAAYEGHKDAEVVARKAGSVVTVLRQDITRLKLASTMVDNLKRANVHIAGCILNKL